MQHKPDNGQSQTSISDPATSQNVEPALQLLEDGDSENEEDDQQASSVPSSRYPSRTRHPPSRLTDYVRH